MLMRLGALFSWFFMIWDDRLLQDALAKIETSLPTALGGCVTKATMAIEAKAKEKCPVSTGTLRRSIMSDVTTNADGTAEGIVGSNLEYAPYVHQGTGIYAVEGNGRKQVPWYYYDEKLDRVVQTKGIHPTPFLQEAVDEESTHITEYFAEVLEQCLK